MTHPDTRSAASSGTLTPAQRAAQAPQMGLGAAFALVIAGILAETTDLAFDGTTVGAWTALCEGIWQMIRRAMEG